MGDAVNVDLSTYVTQTDGDSITLYLMTGNLPDGVVFDPATWVLSWNAQEAGVFDPLQVQAFDDDGWSNQVSFRIEVIEIIPAGPFIQDLINNPGAWIERSLEKVFKLGASRESVLYIMNGRETVRELSIVRSINEYGDLQYIFKTIREFLNSDYFTWNIESIQQSENDDVHILYSNGYTLASGADDPDKIQTHYAHVQNGNVVTNTQLSGWSKWTKDETMSINSQWDVFVAWREYDNVARETVGVFFAKKQNGWSFWNVEEITGAGTGLKLSTHEGNPLLLYRWAGIDYSYHNGQDWSNTWNVSIAGNVNIESVFENSDGSYTVFYHLYHGGHLFNVVHFSLDATYQTSILSNQTLLSTENYRKTYQIFKREEWGYHIVHSQDGWDDDGVGYLYFDGTSVHFETNIAQSVDVISDYLLRASVLGDELNIYVNGKSEEIIQLWYIMEKIFTQRIADIWNEPPSAACQPPTTGNWVLTESCEMSQSATAPADVILEPGVVLTILPDVTLHIDLKNQKLHIKSVPSGTWVLIKDWASLKQSP